MPVMIPEDVLRMMVSADQDPTLSNEELHTLLTKATAEAVYKVWQPDTAYSVGQKVTPTFRNGIVYVVTTAGTSGSVEPPFGNSNGLTDNTVVWAVSTTEVSYNFNYAAAEGWLVKAGKVANRFDMKTEVTSTERSQIYKMCMDQRKAYLRKLSGTVIVTQDPTNRVGGGSNLPISA